MTMWWIRVLKAVAMAVLTALLLLFVFSLIAYRADDPDRMVAPLGITALMLGAAACGITAGIMERREETGGLFSGLAACGLYLLVGCIVSWFFGDDGKRMWFGYPASLALAFLSQLVLLRLTGKTKRVSPAKLRKNTLKKLSGR